MAAEQKIAQLLTIDNANDCRNLDTFRVWLLQQFKSSSNNQCECRFEDFAVYFINAVRQQTELHLRPNEVETPKCQTPVRRASAVATSNASFTPKRLLLLGQQQQDTIKQNSQLQQHALCSEDNNSALLNDSWLSVDSHNSTPWTAATPQDNLERSFNQSFASNASTPVRRTPVSFTSHNHQQRRSANSFHNNSNSCTTPNSTEKTTRNNSVCLGDFLVMNATPSRGHRRKQETSTPTTTKPKKRVVPTTISSRSSSTAVAPFGNSSAFSNDNNILKLANTEVDDRNQCAILEARKSLASRELDKSVVCDLAATALTVASETASNTNELPTPPIDLSKVTQPAVIDRIADIYAILIDMNITVNVLSELSFLINILNANETDQSPTEALSALELDGKLTMLSDAACNLQPKRLELLRNATNCVYFALRVLKTQRQLLAMLDLKSLGVVLHSERLVALDVDLQAFLSDVYQRKQSALQQSKQDDEFSIRLSDKSFNNVYYQADKDSRQNFSSNNEFGAFKSQRDLFYQALKHWESSHLQTTWNFAQEIAPKIREIFKLSEHPTNMEHLANLFVSQLIMSSNYATSPEEIGVDIDLLKFNKLTQRLVAPSNFSVDYQFPHNQAFFRDFICEARSMAFWEQLKLCIYEQLMALNDSTFELLPLLPNDVDEVEHAVDPTEYVVRADVLSSMQLLAKFLGFVTALPFNCNGCTAPPSNIDKRQIALRSQFQPDFNVAGILQRALQGGKLLVTVPWLVQYLSMLDNVTLQLESYSAVTQLLCCIYTHMNAEKRPTCQSAALFIVRCCLGWLFDTQPIIAEQYYVYRVSSPQHKEQQMPVSILQTRRNKNTSQPWQLEALLNVACPFLAQFRVSIMPAKHSMAKYVSRSGRYRHITTRMSELNVVSGALAAQPTTVEHGDKAAASPKQRENKLTEAFLHAQNSTMRRLIEYVVERAYKSTVKDAQYQILLPSKAAADKQVNDITDNEYKPVLTALQSIYGDARQNAIEQWNASVPQILHKRIELALEGLLPQDTQPIIKSTYCQLIRRNAATKIDQWRHANLFKSNFYCSNFEELTQKICKANSKATPAVQNCSELRLLSTSPSISDLLDELQYWLHCTTMRPELLDTDAPIIGFLRTVPLVFDNVLPTALYRVLGVGLVQLLQNLIAQHPRLLSETLLDATIAIWLCKEMQHNVVVLQLPETNVNAASDCEQNMPQANTPGILDGLITISFIESLGAQPICYDRLKDYLVSLILDKVITVAFVNDLFVPIFKYDWPANVLNEISRLLTTIAMETVTVGGGNCYGGDGGSGDDDGRSHLFMEVLADFARDVDKF